MTIVSVNGIERRHSGDSPATLPRLHLACSGSAIRQLQYFGEWSFFHWRSPIRSTARMSATGHKQSLEHAARHDCFALRSGPNLTVQLWTACDPERSCRVKKRVSFEFAIQRLDVLSSLPDKNLSKSQPSPRCLRRNACTLVTASCVASASNFMECP